MVSAPRRAPCKIKDFIPCGTVLADISRGPSVGRHHSPPTRPPIHIIHRRSFVVSAPRRAPCKIKDFIPCGTVLADISRGPPVGRHHSPTTRSPIQFFIVYTFILNKMQEKNKCSFKKFADKRIFSLVGIIYFFS